MADRLMLFSGGMDSYILKRLHGFSDEECLFVDMGTKENVREKALLRREFPGIERIGLPLAQFALPNHIIPFRNTFLICLAAQYAPNIYAAFTAGDTTRDKDHVFKAQMEGMLNYFIGVPDKSPVGEAVYVLHLPYKTMTKGQMVAEFLRKGFDPMELRHRTVSCYEGGEAGCGECRSCLRKYVALKSNGIDCASWFDRDPSLNLSAFREESLLKNRKLELTEINQCTPQN